MQTKNKYIEWFLNLPTLSERNKRARRKLVRFKNSELYKTFNADKYNKVISYMENEFVLPNGEHGKLLDHLGLVLTLMFCYDMPLREIGFFIGRSNAKSVLGTAVAHLLLVLNDKPNQSMKFIAITKEVAESEMFGHLKLSLTEGVVKYHKLQITNDSIKVPYNTKLRTKGSSVIIRGSDEKKLDGGRETLVCVDELGAMTKSPLTTLRQGLAKNNGLLLVMSTNNIVRNGAWDVEIPIFETYLDDDDFSRWSFFFELENIEEVDNEDNWIKANPALDITVKREDIRKDLMEAKLDPSKANIVMAKRFNLTGTDTSIFFNPDSIIRNTVVKDINIFKDYNNSVVVGCDFSQSGDTWGNVVLTKIDGIFHAFPIAIRPEGTRDDLAHLGETLTHKSGRNDSIEGCFVFLSAIKGMDIRRMGYDPQYSKLFFKEFDELVADGTDELEQPSERIPIMQNSFKVSATIKLVRRLLDNDELKLHGNLLGAHLMNARVKTQVDSDLVRLVKNGKNNKIDLADSLVNAMEVWEDIDSSVVSFYE